MGIAELSLLGAGLAMDAFAAALCKGLNMKKINYTYSLVIAVFFSVFQGLMPLVGWFAGVRFKDRIEIFDHWIVFFLLVFIGTKMIYEAENKNEEVYKKSTVLDLKELTVLAFATSVDAMAVGISLSFLNTDILFCSSVIAFITLMLSFLGVILGNKYGGKYGKKAEISGGVILVIIGIKILIEHLLG